MYNLLEFTIKKKILDGNACSSTINTRHDFSWTFFFTRQKHLLIPVQPQIKLSTNIYKMILMLVNRVDGIHSYTHILLGTLEKCLQLYALHIAWSHYMCNMHMFLKRA